MVPCFFSNLLNFLFNWDFLHIRGLLEYHVILRWGLHMGKRKIRGAGLIPKEDYRSIN